jgi:tetratricopeptide (TPR) repeat protein
MEWVFRLAYIAGEYDEALDRLELITQLDDPWQLTSLSDRIFYGLAREFNTDDQNDHVIRLYQMLFQSPHFDRLSADIRSASASRMLKQKLKNKKIGDVGDLLTKISSPYYYTEMLSDRIFEPIWPQIEQRAGPNMANILTPYLKEMKSEFELDPENLKKKQIYGHALLFTGRFEDIIALAGTIDRSDAAIRNWGEDDGWLLNLEAYAEDALGDAAAADRIFDQFAAIDYRPEENGWLVNFIINRASRLVGQRRWEEGLDAAKTAGTISEKSGSPFANMLVRWSKLCALHGLGRSEEAQAMLSEIVEQQDDALLVAAQAMLCVGERERAATLMIKGLEDDTKRDQFIEALQKPEFELFYAESSLPSINGELRHHPDVAKLFDRLARDVPDEYIPMVGEKRRELAAERETD